MRARALITAAFVAIATVTFLAEPASAASPIQVGKIQYDSPGTDNGSNASLNGEWVTIKNTGRTNVVLTNWTLRDAANHIYKFGVFTLGALKSVVVHTGRNPVPANSATHKYWGSRAYIWNNTGDTATLRNAAGASMDSCRWTSAGFGYTNC
jgi:hypothetical protein